MSTVRIYRRDTAPAALTNNFDDDEDAYWEDDDFCDEPEPLPDFEKIKKDLPSLTRGIASAAKADARPTKVSQGESAKNANKDTAPVTPPAVVEKTAVPSRLTTPARNDSK